MTNMADHVKLARIYGDQWGVSITSPDGGAFATKDIDNLISQIALTAHVAEGRNSVTLPNYTDISLVMTCGACPEQYDAYYDGEQVGYLRLRHGYFTAQFRDPSGPIVYESPTYGDGIFEPEERDHHLTQARMAIADRLRVDAT